MPPTYSVLGSCVTRDAADMGASPLPKPRAYFSRTKIQSVMSTPTVVVSDDIGLSSPFQTRAVLEDHSKAAVSVLASLDHPLVIDLIDERFKLLDSGSGLVTESLQFRQSVLPKTREYAPVPPDDELTSDGPFALAAAALADVLPDVRVVVHRAFWALQTTEGEPLERATLGSRTNDWLTRAYDLLERTIPGAVSVEPGPEVTVADPEHRWGLAPFHYSRGYYDLLQEQLLDAIGG